MDTAVSDVGVWRKCADTSATHERNSHESEDIESIANPIPEGCQQQLHVRHELQHHQLFAQAKESQARQAGLGSSSQGATSG
jgi:hypothetical protein